MTDLPLGYEIVAEPVEWNGDLFRSKLECKWAKALAVLGYSYEPHQFDLGDFGMYTPDFFVPLHENQPEKDLMIEIKPRAPLLHEIIKSYMLQKQFPGAVIFFIGPPNDAVRGGVLPYDAKNNVLDAAGIPWKLWDKGSTIPDHRCAEVRGL